MHRIVPIDEKILHTAAVRADILTGTVEEVIDIRRLGTVVLSVGIGQQQSHQFADSFVERRTG